MKPLPKVDPLVWRSTMDRLGGGEYDGLRGSPPTWVPSFKRADFDSARRRAATFLVLQPRLITEGGLCAAIQRAGQLTTREAEHARAELLFKREYEGWALDAWSLMTLVNVYHATQLGKVEGLRYLTDRDTGDRLSGEQTKSRMRQIARHPRLSRRALSDEVVKPIAADLVGNGVQAHNLVSEVCAVLEQRGISPPSKPTLRKQLGRLGYVKKES